MTKRKFGVLECYVRLLRLAGKLRSGRSNINAFLTVGENLTVFLLFMQDLMRGEKVGREVERFSFLAVLSQIDISINLLVYF